MTDPDEESEWEGVDRGHFPETIVILRHARSHGNDMTAEERANLPLGTTLYELTPLGEQQADITGGWLRERYPDPDVILRSYYTRTRRTAEIAYPDRPIFEDERLAEANRGIFHVRSDAWMREHQPWEIERREQEGLYHYCPPGGENGPVIERRIRDIRRSLRRRFAGKTVVLVTHGNWILFWQKRIHRWSIDEYLERYRGGQIAENASVLIYHGVVEGGRGRLVHDPAHDYIIPWKGKLPEPAGTPA